MKARLVNLSYIPSDNRTVQGTYQKIRPYLNDGFYVKEERNGFYVLVKPASVVADVEVNGKYYESIGVKELICSIYQKNRISRQIVDKFKQDVLNERIILDLDSNGYLTIVNS